MHMINKPAQRPARPQFSSGPCVKRPGWDLQNFTIDALGRSHRSKLGKARLKQAIDKTRAILNMPQDYLIGIVPGSDTGAFEMAMWTMLGARGVDILAWESFGAGWVSDIAKQLKVDDLREMTAAYGDLPDLTQVDFSRDVVFTWNGTTSGVCVPDGAWIDAHRTGLTFCDATSALFACDMPWDKLDVTTFSWQKVLGGEGAHGMIILSPRAVERLETYTPPWPLPKVFRLTKGGKISEGIFRGETINTPSMLAVEDYLDALNWAEQIGGLSALIARAQKNKQVLDEWVAKSNWIDFLCRDESHRSPTSICLKITHSDIATLDEAAQAAFAKKLVGLLEEHEIAYDIGAYRDAPAGLRIWAGGTVEAEDIHALTLWLDWAFAHLRP